MIGRSLPAARRILPSAQPYLLRPGSVIYQELFGSLPHFYKMSNTIYEVHLPVFDGPLDLLLHLIEREKLDISVVSLAQVAGQFLDHVRDLEVVAPGTLADFLAVAARLVWIKSRLLLPQPRKAEDELEEDPGEALARQLREYKRFKEVAQALQGIAARGQRAFVRVAPAPEMERHLAGGEVSLADFLAAAVRAFAARPTAPPVDTVVTPLTLTIHDQIGLIAHLTAGGRPVTFSALLQRARHRVEVIVTLLAVLELLKRRKVVASQEGLFGEIMITPAPGEEIGDEIPENGE